MKSFAKVFIISSMLIAGGHASAQVSGQKAVSGVLGAFSSSIGTISDNDNSASSNLSGFFGLGGDFDYFIDSDMSVGAIFRYYSTSDTLSHTDYTNTLMTTGGVFRAYLLDTRHFSFIGTTGLGLTQGTVKQSPPAPGKSVSVDSGMTLGLYMGMTCQYKLNSNMRIGVENLRILGLGRGRLNGWVLSDYMAKFTYLF
ncbi:MAG: hypothetical protein ACXVA9_07020 [Bdellovibrionales bacterium]